MEPKRSAVQIILIAISLVGLAIIVWRISDVIVICFGSVIGATALRALALPLARLTKLSEKWNLSFVLTGALVVFGLLGWLFGRQIIQQINEAQQSLPEAGEKIMSALRQTQIGGAFLDLVKQAGVGSKTLSGVGAAASAVLVGLADFFLIVFLSIYLAFDPDPYLDGFLRLLPPPRRGPVKRALLDAGSSLRGWLIAQLIAMVLIGVMVGIAMALLGVPFALLLGVFAGFLEFVPVVGAIVFSVPGILLAFAKSPLLALYAVITYIVVQQIESNIIIPLLQRWAVRLAPGITLISVVVGGLLFGLPGVVFATPMAVVVLGLVKHLYVEDALEHPRAAPTDQ